MSRDDTLVSAEILEAAVKDIMEHVAIDRIHDVPYLAGYSRDGKRIYIDRHLPGSFELENGNIVFIDKFLILHEVVEKSLIESMNLVYQHAHQIALRAEEAAVRAFNIPWHEYNKFMDEYIKEAADERLSYLPVDLDIKPYRDEHDFKLLKCMQESIREEIRMGGQK